METWDAITSRRDVRRFEERPLDRDALLQILEAGRRAPSGRNWQPWDFVVVTDPEQLRGLAKVGPGAEHVEGSAVTICLTALGFTDNAADRERMRFDLGQATMAMMIAASDLGVGAGHAAVYEQEAAREILGVPAERCVYYMIDLGYPAEGPMRPIRQPDRRSFDDVVHWGRW